MGSKYKRKLEIEWAGKSLGDIKKKMLKHKMDTNISDVIKGRYKRKGGKK